MRVLHSVCLLSLTIWPLAATAKMPMGEGMSLREAYFGDAVQEERERLPKIARFESEGGVSFVLDRSGAVPYLRFDGQAEVWALRSVAATRGDVDFFNDTGQRMLRMTALGGVTVFHHGAEGVPAALVGPVDTALVDAGQPTNLSAALLQAAMRLARSKGQPVAFRVERAPPGSEALFADAARAVADGLAQTGLKISRVLLRPGRGGRIERTVDGGLIVEIDVERGIAGRPSSAKIATIR